MTSPERKERKIDRGFFYFFVSCYTAGAVFELRYHIMGMYPAQISPFNMHPVFSVQKSIIGCHFFYRHDK